MFWLQETTARLLFMAVRWVRCLAPFQTLSKRDQVSSHPVTTSGWCYLYRLPRIVISTDETQQKNRLTSDNSDFVRVLSRFG